MAAAAPVTRDEVRISAREKLDWMVGRSYVVSRGRTFVPTRVSRQYRSLATGPHQGYGGGELCGRVNRRQPACYGRRFSMTYGHPYLGLHVVERYYFGGWELILRDSRRARAAHSANLWAPVFASVEQVAAARAAAVRPMTRREAIHYTDRAAIKALGARVARRTSGTRDCWRSNHYRFRCRFVLTGQNHLRYSGHLNVWRVADRYDYHYRGNFTYMSVDPARRIFGGGLLGGRGLNRELPRPLGPLPR